MGATRGNSSGNSGGVQPIPAGARDVVHSLKEIVNCSDAEIYAALKECNLDPNEAVIRLLAQDPFREVKCKREKKKEGKDNTEAKPRSNGNVNRGGKSGSERYPGRHSSAPYTSDSSSFPGKSFNKKENGPSHASYMASVRAVMGHGRNTAPFDSSEGFSAESRGSSWISPGQVNDGGTSEYVPPSKSAWISPGQVSMADILKMGKQFNGVQNDQSFSHQMVHGNIYTQDHDPKNSKPEMPSVHNSHTNSEWPSMKQQFASTNLDSPSDWNIDSENHIEVSNIPSSVQNVPHLELEAGHHSGHYSIETLGGREMLSESMFTGKTADDGFRDPPLYENKMYENMSAYQHHPNGLHEVEDIGESVSSVTQTLQQLSVNRDDQGSLSEGYVTSVVIPDHLQVTDADCSHLSFGSFGAGLSVGQLSGVAASVPSKINLEHDLPSEPTISSVRHADSRISEAYDGGSHLNASSGGFYHGDVAASGNYDPQLSQPSDLKHETTESQHGTQYSFPSASSGYKFDDLHGSATAYSGTSSQIKELAPFSNAGQPYPDSHPGVFSSVNVHPAREPDVRYSPFPSTQLMSDRYGASVSNGSSVIAPENLTEAGSSAAETILASVSGSTLSPLPQQPSMNPYSQPNLPLGPLANLVTYPSYLPQNYTYLPSAYQQTYAGNSGYPQSLAGVPPQYKNMISSGALPQYAAVGPGYGSFGNNTSIPVNFPMNPAAVPSGSNSNIDNVLLSLLQQNELLHGHNSRTMPAVPSNSFYNYQPNQQTGGGGFRQAQQQPSQNYGNAGMGYHDPYNSHMSLSPELSQNARDIGLGGSQTQSKQSQLWQNGGY